MFFRSLGRNIIKVVPKNVENSHPLLLRISNGEGVDGMLVQNFSRKYYSFISGVCDLTIDIGASIGDSSIFLNLKGAKKVIALESNLDSYSIAKENVEKNGLQDEILVLNAGYCFDGSIKVKNSPGNPNNVLEYDEEGLEIPVFSLKTLIYKYFDQDEDINSLILHLKVSCAGCEKFLLSEEERVLKFFSKIQIKFENGYSQLFKKFENLGYSVRISFLEYPKRGWLYVCKTTHFQQEPTTLCGNLVIPLDEFMTQFSSVLANYEIPLVQTPEFNFSFNQSENRRPLVSVSCINQLIFSVITFNEHKIKGIKINEANIRGGPVVIRDGHVLNYNVDSRILNDAVSKDIKEHLNFTVEYLQKNKHDILIMEPLEIWQDKLDDILKLLSYHLLERCDLFFALPDSPESLLESFKRLAKRKIKLSLNSGVLVEEIPVNEIETHIKNLGQIWVEMWKRSGKLYDSQTVEQQVIKLSLAGIAKIFGAKIGSEYVAYRIVLIDKASQALIDFSAPSNLKAFETGANYLLVYSAMLFAIKNNYRKWVFWGISCNPTPGSKEDGIYKFKGSFVADVNDAKIVSNIHRIPISLTGGIFLYLLERRIRQ